MKGRCNLGNLDPDGRIILKTVLNNCFEVVDWIHVALNLWVP
jgi:hypothetical protein